MSTWEKIQWFLLFVCVGSVIAGAYLIATGWEQAKRWFK